MELSAAAGGALDIQGEPAGDPASAFDGEELAHAEAAWKGDVSSATSLAGEWRGDLSVYLARPLQANDAGRAWRAVRTTEVVVQEMAGYPWWRTGELIREGDRSVVVAVVDESPVDLQTPSFALISLDRLGGPGPDVRGTAMRRAQVASSCAGQLPDEIPLPEDMEPSGVVVGAEAVVDSLCPRADACAWAWLSNATRVIDGVPYATLEYFGYRRRSFQLGAAGYIGEAGGRAVPMYKWATQEISPDRVLAIRQVMSLHDDGDLPGRPLDIVRAAEPLYQALRAGEVAAVLETQRQARSIAVDAARGSAEGAQAAAKSAAERTIASLAAVVGIAIANATAVLTDSNARAIALGIAGLFVFLAAWTIFVEAPMMRAPLASFTADLPTVGHLLPEADRAEILRMQALTTAGDAVFRVRIAAPIVYVAGAVISVAVAHYAFALHS
jgi:hypothetical protein